MTLRTVLATVAMSAAALLAVAAPASAQTPTPTPQATPSSAAAVFSGLPTATGCRDVTVPVTVAGVTGQQSIAGTVCAPTGWSGGSRTVDVYVHGATYTRDYWNGLGAVGQFPDLSWVQRDLGAGRAAVFYDALGAGRSSRPPSATNTVAANADVLHQIVAGIKQVPGAHVNVIAHSFGSTVAISEAATNHDADRVVVTGLLHHLGEGSDDAQTSFYPAVQDPKFAGQAIDPGYLTSVPGARKALFYFPGGAAPAVIARDEATKDVVSSTLFGGALGQTTTPAAANPSRQITAPVLTLIGDSDRLSCGADPNPGGTTLDCGNVAAVTAYERPYYTGAHSLTAKVVSHTGHDIALHTSSGAAWAIVNAWLGSAA